MKKSILILGLLAAALAATLYGAKVDREGRIWLDARQGAPEVNVNGTWTSKVWGKVVLNQGEDSRDIIGRGDGWNILGVVAGNKVYLIFSYKNGLIAYSAELTADSPNTLVGGYTKGLLFPGMGTRSMSLSR
jgi:hypothetical protein